MKKRILCLIVALSMLLGSYPMLSFASDAEYNEESACYHVPIQSPTAVYVPVLDTINRDGRVYTVRVSYVLSQDIEYDYRGKEQEPTADMGKFAQIFVVQKNEDDTWTILSVEYEK